MDLHHDLHSCCSPATCLLCVLALGVTRVTAAQKVPRESHRSRLYRTRENAAGSFKVHL